MRIPPILVIFMILAVLLFIVPGIVTLFLRSVEAGTIRMVSWWGRQDPDLSRAGQILRNPAAHHRHHAFQ